MSNIERFLDSTVDLEQMVLQLIDVPQKTVFRSGIGERKSRLAIIVKWIDSDGTYGYGECSCRPDPYYSEEFSSGALQVIEKFIFPLIKDCKTYREVIKAMQRIRGWNFTKAAVENAMNDMLRRKHGKGILEHWDREKLEKIPVGISMGLQPSEEVLFEKADKALDISYHRLKFKVNPASVPEHFIKLNEQREIPHISFDANGTFDAGDIPTLKKYAVLGTAFEQAFAPHNNHLYHQLKQEHPEMKTCLDESVKYIGDLDFMNRMHCIDELNIKPGRVGGWYYAIQMADYAKSIGVPCWIGGMFETGIGRSQNIQMAAYITEAVAHDLSPSERYFVEDILETPVRMDNEGYIKAEEYNHFEVNQEVLERLTVEKISLK